MAQDFDPYYKWLGIPPKDQPPHYYRLLGLEPLESDREVIDAAANRVMAYLRSLATGEDAEHSQRLLNEVAAARQCLLHPQKKATYDEQLRLQLAAKQPAVPVEGAQPRAGITAGGPSAPQPPPAPPPPTIAPVPPRVFSPVCSVPAHLVQETPARGPSSRSASPKEGPVGRNNTTLAWSGLLGAAAVVLLGLILAVSFSYRQPARRAEPRQTRAWDVAKRRGHDRPARAKATSRSTSLSLYWPPPERHDAEVLIDGLRRGIPRTDSHFVDYSLAPGRHTLVIERAGYKPVEHHFELEEGEMYEYAPAWTPSEGAEAGKEPPREWPDLESPEPLAAKPKPAPSRPSPAKPPRPADAELKPKPSPSPAPPTPAAAPLDPFHAMPAEVDLPELLAKTPNETFTLATLATSTAQRWELSLYGGEQVLKARAGRTRRFVLSETTGKPTGTSWTVRLVESGGGQPDKQTDVAEFWRDHAALRFRWMATADPSSANYLRYCILEVAAAGKSRSIVLTEPKRVEPVIIDLQRKASKSPIRLRYCPELERLCLEEVRLEGPAGAKVEHPETTARGPVIVAFSRKDRSGAAADTISFSLTLQKEPKETLCCEASLPEELVSRIKQILPDRTELPIPGSRLAPLKNKLLAEKQQAEKALAEAKNDEQRAGPRQTLDTVESQLWYLEFAQALHRRARIHFRVVYRIGDRRVAVATSSAPAAPAGPSSK